MHLQTPPWLDGVLMRNAPAALVQLVAILLLVMSGVAKLWNIQQFKRAVLRHELLPAPLAIAISWATGPLELGLGLTIFLIPSRAAIGVASFTFLVFAAWTVATLVRRGPLECGCLGGFARLRHGYFAASANACVGVGLAITLGGPVNSVLAAGVPVLSVSVLMALVYWLGVYAESVTRTMNLALRTGTRS